MLIFVLIMKRTDTKQRRGVSVVAPTLNEQGSVRELVLRLDATMKAIKRPYELIVVDDHSSDATVSILRELRASYPILIFEKRGLRGKAYSLLEGFGKARYSLIAMIDADLQYSPEALGSMVERIEAERADVVLTRRVVNDTGWLRKLSSAIFKFAFVQILFGIRYDTQSGLKLFRRSVLAGLNLQPTQWSFDLEFIVRARLGGAAIISEDISFGARLHDEVKISLVSAAIEMAQSSLRLKAALLRSALRRPFTQS